MAKNDTHTLMKHGFLPNQSVINMKSSTGQGNKYVRDNNLSPG